MVIAFFIFLIFLFAPSKMAASEPTVVLNEIYPPTTSDWVELYNNSSNEVDLSNWKLLDTATTPMKVLEENKKISPKSFLVIEVSSRLNKSGDTIRLIDKDGVEVDSYKYSTSSENRSFARIPDGSGSWFGDQNPTKESSNGTNPPKDTKQSYLKISLSEIFPNPQKGEKEWVEIYNPNKSRVELSDWKLIDAANHSKKLSGSVAGNSYKVFYFSSGWLNNSGDSVKLVDPNGKQVENYQYGKIEKKFSLAKNSSGDWKLTSTPTPGKTNKITGDSNSILTSGGGFEENDTEILESTGLKSTVDFIANSFQTDFPTSAPAGEVAGVSERKNSSNSLTTLLISAGIAFLGTAIVWPFLEKKGLV